MMPRPRKLPWIMTSALLFVSLPVTVFATHPCTSPLILDLDGDGVRTTTLNYPVNFDINGDGALEVIAWTFPRSEEGFLWLDLNRNRQVDSGAELFGDSTRLADGSLATSGFEALAEYDSPDLGGDGDGRITPRDRVWAALRLWVDESHDARSQASEIHRLRDFGLAAINLEFQTVNEVDGGGNIHLYRGEFEYRSQVLGRPMYSKGVIDDVIFTIAGHD